ncbi:MAG: bifunctional adenosylcobinamide kinase/adenosylcobinamide-phosphate guanylyltransferase [Bacillota bacterium]|nr:bifunctional adenosylcobinamide kinase/adenosylcobinamide-phosphate guanylyltransferase [Bacillota bacterium]
MGKLTVVTGGARSGKSSFAEEIVKGISDKVLYIATANAFDDEMKHRIKKHQEQRPQSWDTLEAYRDFDKILRSHLKDKEVVMLDCITVMITNIMFEECLDWNNINMIEVLKIEDSVNREINSLLEIIKDSGIPFIMVTNELGMGLVPEFPSGRAFRDIAGKANQLLAKAADEVYLCVSGIPVKIK